MREIVWPTVTIFITQVSHDTYFVQMTAKNIWLHHDKCSSIIEKNYWNGHFVVRKNMTSFSKHNSSGFVHIILEFELCHVR